MEFTEDRAAGKAERAVICGVIALALAMLGGIALLPRPGEPVLLVPLGAKGKAALPALLSAPDTLILARGTLADSYVITGERPGVAESLVTHGILLVNASAPGCAPD